MLSSARARSRRQVRGGELFSRNFFSDPSFEDGRSKATTPSQRRSSWFGRGRDPARVFGARAPPASRCRKRAAQSRKRHRSRWRQRRRRAEVMVPPAPVEALARRGRRDEALGDAWLAGDVGKPKLKAPPSPGKSKRDHRGKKPSGLRWFIGEARPEAKPRSPAMGACRSRGRRRLLARRRRSLRREAGKAHPGGKSRGELGLSRSWGAAHRRLADDAMPVELAHWGGRGEAGGERPATHIQGGKSDGDAGKERPAG